jgi:hypothetical protein
VTDVRKCLNIGENKNIIVSKVIRETRFIYRFGVSGWR